MPPTKFKLNPTNHSRLDVVSGFSSWPQWRPLWMLERNEFSNSTFPCHPNTSHQVWAQTDLPFRSRHGLKIFKMATVSWISEQNDFSHSESLCCSDASHQFSAQSHLRLGRKWCLKIFEMADMAAILEIGTEWFYQFYLSMWPKYLPTSLG